MQESYIGKNCPYCKTPITKSDAVAICDTCDMPHHLSCWRDNQGCTTFGCTGSIRQVLGATPVPAREAEPVEEAPQEAPIKTLYETNDTLILPDVALALENVALIIDRGREKLFVRCTFRSISDKSITAALVEVRGQDVWGSAVGEPVTFQYLDLKTARENKFGQTEPIEIPDITTRKVQVTVKKVLLTDGTVIEGGEAAVSLGVPTTLETHLGSKELEAQYRRETVPKAQVLPEKAEGYWRCACGCINTEAEEACHGCGSTLQQLMAALDKENLAANEKAYAEAKRIAEEKAAAEQAERIRLAEEQVKQEQEERQKRLKEEEKKKKKKKALIAAAISLILVVAIACGTIFFGIPFYKYQTACAVLESGQYDAAREAFLALGDFLDSANMANEALYQKAEAKLAAKEYEAAIEIFTSLGSYRDSADQVKESKYQKGLAQLSEKRYEFAIKTFEELGAYKDSTDQLLEAKYQQAQYYSDQKYYKAAYERYEELGDYKDSRKNQTVVLMLWTADALSGDVSKAKQLCNVVILTPDQYEGYYATLMLFIQGHTDGDEWLGWHPSNAAKNMQLLLKELPASYKDTGRLQELFDTLCACEDYEDLRELFKEHDDLLRRCWDLYIPQYLAQSDSGIKYFLVGNWTGSGYYFRMQEDLWSWYDLPWVAKPYGTMYYNIEDGIYFHADEASKKLANVFKFEIIDYNTIRVFCYKNGYTYTIYRN